MALVTVDVAIMVMVIVMMSNIETKTGDCFVAIKKWQKSSL